MTQAIVSGTVQEFLEAAHPHPYPGEGYESVRELRGFVHPARVSSELNSRVLLDKAQSWICEESHWPTPFRVKCGPWILVAEEVADDTGSENWNKIRFRLQLQFAYAKDGQYQQESICAGSYAQILEILVDIVPDLQSLWSEDVVEDGTPIFQDKNDLRQTFHAVGFAQTVDHHGARLCDFLRCK